ncbi:hypothetical protein NPIL_328811 [Nephila pilipes]|uniref:Uncharacterized protein n=1 Tax=Nephila pilipes TaxID=299642 RepID=A0A8X6PJP1_NEPPI|nr:hypothetical protein NPIL_328811 [Nephila pilipes]
MTNRPTASWGGGGSVPPLTTPLLRGALSMSAVTEVPDARGRNMLNTVQPTHVLDLDAHAAWWKGRRSDKNPKTLDFS